MNVRQFRQIENEIRSLGLRENNCFDMSCGHVKEESLKKLTEVLKKNGILLEAIVAAWRVKQAGMESAHGVKIKDGVLCVEYCSLNTHRLIDLIADIVSD